MMIKEEIIEMAKEAGMIPLEGAVNALGKSVPLEWLMDFAKLVRADYGKLHASLWLKRIDDAVKKEREECAKLCDHVYNNIVTDEHIKNMAFKIRARGQDA